MRLRTAVVIALGGWIGGGGASARDPWTTSRVEGTPEPAKSFTTVPEFSGVGGREVLELVAVPGQRRFLAVERGGRVFTFADRPDRDDPGVAEVIDLKALHPDTRSAYGAAFPPRFRESRELYLAYTVGPDGPDGTRLSRFRLAELDPPRADPASEEVILTWRSGGHNGANLRFGPEGFLYVSTGDATAPNPPDGLNTGQDLSDWLGSILRIDVGGKDPARGLAYRIPEDNPFLDWPGARPENWAYGFRNPWKMSFDPGSGDLWVGDVGWELWEMIHRVRRGGNHGWSAVEATQPIRPDVPANPSPIVPPAAAHPHTEAASITGGFVYQGGRFPELRGAYVYGDYETGKIWALWHDGERVTRREEIADTAHKIVTFGQDEAGELHLVHYGTPATFHGLARHPEAGKVSAFPRRLSGTGLFADTARQVPAPGVYGYEVAEPLWQDGAEAERFVALPGSSRIGTELRRRADGTVERATVTWPAGAVLARTVRREDRPVETQLLHHDGESWHGYSYRWNGEGTDAELVAAEGETTPGWTFHSRAECARCHHSWSGFAVAFQPEQVTAVDGRPAEEALPALGLATPEWFESRRGRLAGRHGEGTSEERARSWLHANCAHCHRRHAGGSVALQVNIDLPLAETRLVDEVPLRGDFGLPEARIIVPGVPSRSVLLHRLLRHGSGRMPVLGSREPDPEGIRRLRDWIAGMPGGEAEPEEPVSRDRAPGDVREAMRLVLSLDAAGPEGADPGRVPAVAAAWRSGDANVRELFERFRPAGERAATVGTSPDEAALAALPGDAARGRALVAPEGKLAVCLTCHVVEGRGRDFGPDLAAAGARLDRRALLAGLLRPSETVEPAYRGVEVETRDGKVRAGFVVRRDAGGVVLKLPDGRTEDIPAGTVRRERWWSESLMPEGLLAGVTPQDAADLLAYLAALGAAAGR